VTLHTHAPEIFTYIDGGQAEGLGCTDLGVRTPISVSGNYVSN
jgi:hypothetical protein